MNGVDLTLYLSGAAILGLFFGFAYTKLRLSEKYEHDTKNLRDLLSMKDAEFVSLKKDYRTEHRKRIHFEAKVDELEKQLKKKIQQFNLLKDSIKRFKNELKQKNQQIKELELLLLDIQKDYTVLEEELNKQKTINTKLKEEYKQKIEELTQKANDLYMVKGTEELKHAKEVFNSLRKNALNKL